MEDRILKCGARHLNLNRAQIMGILNVTPDSFSDGGQFAALDNAMAQADRMLQAGAAIIDVGGESTRPGAEAVSEQQELDRVMPVLQAIVERFDTIVSVDTSKAQVMREATRAGAGMLNDVRALREPGAMKAATESGLPVCLMHMMGQPRSMQKAPKYANVVNDVSEFLKERVKACRSAGVGEQQLLVDPGFGFGKTLSHNVELLRNLGKLADIAPVLAGLSRKRMIAGMLGNPHTSRVTGSVVAAMHCVQQGASIIRVHDVAQTAQALRVTNVVQYGIKEVADATQ